ncbi:hypothetical protein P3T16_001633 [Paraburkholderia sp. GAS42]|jgi:hypothetical protein
MCPSGRTSIPAGYRQAPSRQLPPSRRPMNRGMRTTQHRHRLDVEADVVGPYPESHAQAIARRGGERAAGECGSIAAPLRKTDADWVTRSSRCGWKCRNRKSRSSGRARIAPRPNSGMPPAPTTGQSSGVPTGTSWGCRPDSGFPDLAASVSVFIAFLLFILQPQIMARFEGPFCCRPVWVLNSTRIRNRQRAICLV